MEASSNRSAILPEGAYHAVPRIFERLRDPGAPAWQFEPNLAITHWLLYKEHHLPWWNPYQALGTPYAAAMIPQPFYPLATLAAIHPSARTLSWFVVLRLFVAGLLAYGFLRLFLAPMPSSIGGLAFMLTGYFIVNLNLDNLSTDTLVPLVLFGFEKLIRGKSVSAWVASIFAVWLVLISGMPESAFVILLFGYCYFLFRAPRLIGRLIICNLLGFLLSAFLLVPMLEMLRYGFDVHRGAPYGLIITSLSSNVVLYFLPLIAGPLYSARYLSDSVLIYGYCGVACCVLAITGVLATFRRIEAAQRRLTIFFALALIVALAKLFGIPPVQAVGMLPLFSLIDFPQYMQPVIAFCFAVLCALGVDALLKRLASEELTIAALAVASAVAVGTFRFGAFLPPVGPQNEFATYSLWLGVATIAALLLISWLSRRQNQPRVLFGSLLFVLGAELSLNYIYPIYWYVQPLPPVTVDSYRGAPYIDFLKKSGIGLDRVFGVHSELAPSWAGAVELYDSRILGGIFPGRILPFGRAFFSHNPKATTGDLIDRFTGDETGYTLATPLEQRFLQLTSTRYVLSPTALEMPVSEELIQETLRQNAPLAQSDKPMFNESHFTIDGRTRAVLFEHPRRLRVRLQVQIEAANPVLEFSPAFHQDLFNSPCGDGADFILEAEDTAGKIIPLYKRYVDPKHNKADQHWLDESVDLSRFAGKKVTLLFSTDGGPDNNTSCDWVGWGGITLGPKIPVPPSIPNLHLVYDAENKIYEFAHPLPRAALFQSVKVVNSDEEALRAITNLDIEVDRQTVLVKATLPKTEDDLVTRLQPSSQAKAVPAKILEFDSEHVSVRTESSRDGLLMLTDTFFPGWNVYVDNQRRTVLQADYIFRGVAVEKGSHLVEFRYESSAVATGGYISAAAFLATIGLLLRAWKYRANESSALPANPLPFD